MNNRDISDLCITVIFQDESKFQHSYQLAYHPCPVWMNGPNDYKVTMPESVKYEPGSFEKIVKFTQDMHNCEFGKGKKCMIVADEAWMSYYEEFEMIAQDIRNSGFDVTIVLI